MKKHLITFVAFALTFFAFGQNLDPLATEDFEAQEQWIDSIMSNMTIEEKIGQLFMVAAYSNKGEAHKEEILELIEKYHIGSLIFFQDDPLNQVLLTNEYQHKSQIPLLIGIDGEWGLNMRLKGTYRFPWNMTLGAIQDDDLIEEFGYRVGLHCKRMGIHMNFAPVVDVNTNPENPIIGNRSFGEDPINVAHKSVAFTKGLQQNNVLASAKHFPGHGDTSTDSHLTLPKVDFSAKRIDEVELYPYRKTFDAGLGAVMVAHLSIPSLEPNIELPSSLSYNVVTKLLKQKLGFEGLIITDALNMKGSANYSSSAEINLAAILAGNDLLDVPLEIPETVERFKAALITGELTEFRLNESVRKILKTKYWAGLNEFKDTPIEHLIEDINTIEDDVLFNKLIEASITLVKNEDEIVPVADLVSNKIAYVKLGDFENQKFIETLNNYTKVDTVSVDEITDVKKLKDYDLVIVGVHKSNVNPWKSYKLSDEELKLLSVIAKKNKVILSVFASPYSLLQVENFKNIEAVIVSYQNNSAAQKSTAEIIFGAISSQGKLPVSINDNFAVGSGLNSENIKRLGYALPEEVGMSSAKLAKIDSVFSEIINKEMTPGGQVLVARKGKVIYNKSFGYFTYEKKKEVTNSDVYDLASVTKILGGLPIIMKAEEEKKFEINDKLVDLWPYLKGSNKEKITIKEALSHYAGLTPWIPFYVETLDSLTQKPLEEFYDTVPSRKYPIQVSEHLYLNKSFSDTIYKRIATSDLLQPKRYKYSGVIFLLFKKYIEETYHESMATLLDEHFFKPMGATTLTYNPLAKYDRSRIVPSEIDNYYRNDTLIGYPHDMAAALLGGVSGNAGLFSNAGDVAKMMQMYLQLGYYGGVQYLNPETVNLFNSRYFLDDGVRRGLGFDKPQLDPEVKATCGCMSYNSFGHSGFTGTYTWADPETEIVYVFLSNRTYPTMDNNQLSEEDIRTNIQQYIVEAITE